MILQNPKDAFVFLCGENFVRKEVLRFSVGKKYRHTTSVDFLGNQFIATDRHLSRILSQRLSWEVPATLNGLQEAHKALVAIIEASDNAYIKVARAGKGPTGKSLKVSVEGVVRLVPGRDGYLDSEDPAKTHTITVPASQVLVVNDELYAPRWLLAKTVQERIYKGAGRAEIRGGVWFNADKVWTEFWEPLKSVIEEMDATEAERLVRVAESSQVAQIKYEKEQQTARENEAIAAANLVKAKAAKEKRMASLETISGVDVEWDDWDKVKNAYGSRSMVKVSRSAQGCTLKFSGQRVYITKPGGSEIIKLRKNVRWTSHSLANTN